MEFHGYTIDGNVVKNFTKSSTFPEITFNEKYKLLFGFHFNKFFIVPTEAKFYNFVFLSPTNYMMY